VELGAAAHLLRGPGKLAAARTRDVAELLDVGEHTVGERFVQQRPELF
jgi:hypothetical protein